MRKQKHYLPVVGRLPRQIVIRAIRLFETPYRTIEDFRGQAECSSEAYQQRVVETQGRLDWQKEIADMVEREIKSRLDAHLPTWLDSLTSSVQQQVDNLRKGNELEVSPAGKILIFLCLTHELSLQSPWTSSSYKKCKMNARD